MGWLSDVLDTGSDIVTESVNQFEDLHNNKYYQQAAAAAAGFAVGGPSGAMAAQQSVASVQQGREAAKVAEAQAAQRAIQRRQANVAAVRQRAQALRERRLAEASTQVAAGAQGMESGSAVAGVSAGLSQQAASNLQIISGNQQSQNEMFDLAAQIGRSQTNISQIGALADIGEAGFTYVSKMPRYRNNPTGS